ncbi:hypothetical protein WJX74_007167 [Apatococcus lobatus]|uniref:Uncharacterized protein n=1 Tax=Apatococcus lobatus TaxID=904363 RepID=A0AAW1PRQ2_9CHLO
MQKRQASSIALLALNIVGFGIMLGGLVALQASCSGANQPKEFGDGGLLDPSLTCSDFHQYQWFKVLLQGFMLLLNTLALVTGTLPAFRQTLAIFRAVSTVLLMDAANDYLSVLRTSTGGLRRDCSVFFAGLVISCVDNFLFIITFCFDVLLILCRMHSL